MISATRISIASLGDVVEEYGLVALVPLLEACRALDTSSTPLDVAVSGQFKSGKSSLLNAIIGKPLLPVGAVPVTTVVTRVKGGDASANVTRTDGTVLTIDPARIPDYVSEARNPENREQVALVDIVTPELEDLPGLRLVDTPGLGSVLSHNTQATLDWLPSVAVALVVVSAERPMSEEDRTLLLELTGFAPRIVVVLSKIDLLAPEQRDEVEEFLDGRLRSALGHAVPILPFSTRQDVDLHVARLKSDVLVPVCANGSAERQSALELKLATLTQSCRAYLDAALAAAERDEVERAALQAAVFDESVSEPLARDELKLAAQRVAASARPTFDELLFVYQTQMTSRLVGDLGAVMRSWSGNLAGQVARYEVWLLERMTAEMGTLAIIAEPVADGLVSQAEGRLRRVVEAFRDRLGRNLTRATGVTLPSLAWQPARPRVAAAPVAIGRTLDTQWELLWWVIPMRVFGGVFRRHCARRVSWEVEKNLTRLAGAWSDATTAAVAALELQASRWIHDELVTLRGILSRAESGSDHIRATLRSLPPCASRRSIDAESLRAREA